MGRFRMASQAFCSDGLELEPSACLPATGVFSLGEACTRRMSRDAAECTFQVDLLQLLDCWPVGRSRRRHRTEDKKGRAQNASMTLHAPTDNQGSHSIYVWLMSFQQYKS